MIPLDAADLVVIASRTLGIGTGAALAQMDVDAARTALTQSLLATLEPLPHEPGPHEPHPPPGQSVPEPARRQPDAAQRDAAAEAAAGLVQALLCHQPFPRQGQQVAVAAGLQFLSLNGWRAELDPAPAAVVVEALASGQLTPRAAAAWLSPRLSPCGSPRGARGVPRVGPVRRTVTGVARPRTPPRYRSAVRARAGRVAASALIAGAVSGVALLAACSRGPDMAAIPGPGISAADSHPHAGAVSVAASATCTDLYPLQSRSATAVCGNVTLTAPRR